MNQLMGQGQKVHPFQVGFSLDDLSVDEKYWPLILYQNFVHLSYKGAAEKSVYGCPHVIGSLPQGSFFSKTELTIFSVQQ